MIILKAIQIHSLRMCNENETRLLRKNFYCKYNFYHTIKICRTITFKKITLDLSYDNHNRKNLRLYLQMFVKSATDFDHCRIVPLIYG